MLQKIVQKCSQNGPQSPPPGLQKGHSANAFGTFFASFSRVKFQMPPKGLLGPKMNVKMSLRRAEIIKKTLQTNAESKNGSNKLFVLKTYGTRTTDQRQKRKQAYNIKKYETQANAPQAKAKKRKQTRHGWPNRGGGR